MATPDRSYRRYRSWNADIDETGSDALLDYPSTESIPSKRPRCVSLWTCVLAVVTVVILFLLGFCLGYYIRESLSATQIQTFDCASYRKDKFNDSKLESVHEKIMYFIAEDPGRIRQFVRDFGSNDPISHSPLEKKLEQMIEEEFEEYNFDDVDVQEYNIITTYPDPKKPNLLQLFDSQGKVKDSVSLKNSPVVEDRNTENSSGSAPYVRFPFVSNTLGGSAKGGVFYGHYGRLSDLLTFKGQGINITGQVLLLRLGVTSVAEKLQVAQDAGVAGVLLYWDPLDKELAAPHNASFIPYASAGCDRSSLFTVPTQTISTNMAAKFLRELRGASVPTTWKGGFNTTYRYGAGNFTVKITTFNKRKEVFIRNVVGKLSGYSEPDNYVIVGAPRSSFPGSSTDALVSTALLRQIAWSLQYKKTDQWKPRRGIKLISWGGSEFSNAGMREYIKANVHLLSRRAVAYFDLSELATGNKTIIATVTPALRKLLNTAAHRVPNPLNPETMILEDWDRKSAESPSHWSPFKLYTQDATRHPFLHLVGVPELHLQFVGRSSETPGNIDDMRELDSRHHFKYHIAVSRVVTMAMLRLVDDYVLPYSINDYAQTLHVAVWQTSEAIKECSDEFRDLAPELTVTDLLTETTTAFEDLIQIYRKNQDILGVKSVNEVKMLFERIFVTDYSGKRFSTHHVLYPALHDDSSIEHAQELCRVAKETNKWDKVDKFQQKLYRVLHEALRSLRMNE
ncbi:aminopeptidase NAALADL1-like [Haliotis rufescens]|uniref:aminopeptidase NAALADL1-like n=1 Tax=Haliotis rufescens TaxID=6454 RepID=UPI00201EA98B|nr:aminopeptidase NAALADL1-like [Haliotis rufescens]